MEEEAGRTPGGMSITAFGPDEDAKTIERYAEAGVERIVFNLAPEGEDAVLPLLDAWAKLAEGTT